MKFTLHILGLAVACVAMPALAKPAYVGSTLNLRAAPRHRERDCRQDSGRQPG
jgi:hypothetical protein